MKEIQYTGRLHALSVPDAFPLCVCVCVCVCVCMRLGGRGWVLRMHITPTCRFSSSCDSLVAPRMTVLTSGFFRAHASANCACGGWNR